MSRFLMKLQGKKILPQIKEYFSEKLSVTVVIRRCQLCFKKAKLRVKDKFMGEGIAMALCKKCFKKMFPEYTIDTWGRNHRRNFIFCNSKQEQIRSNKT